MPRNICIVCYMILKYASMHLTSFLLLHDNATTATLPKKKITIK